MSDTFAVHVLENIDHFGSDKPCRFELKSTLSSYYLEKFPVRSEVKHKIEILLILNRTEK